MRVAYHGRPSSKNDGRTPQASPASTRRQVAHASVCGPSWLLGTVQRSTAPPAVIVSPHASAWGGAWAGTSGKAGVSLRPTGVALGLGVTAWVTAGGRHFGRSHLPAALLRRRPVQRFDGRFEVAP